MHLPWRDVPAGLASPLISTSVTGAEANRLAELADGRDVLEVGSAYGYSACVMALAGARHVTAVDPHAWLGSHEAMVSNLDACGVAGQVTVVRGQSPDALAGLGPFGLAFIDGDHGAAAVMADVEAARTVLAPGGVLAVHDYLETCCCPGVQYALDALFPAGPSELVDTLFVVKT
ncbi:MAG TPA: class I SAM-dependent methyltransferase [Streptosporangiaceae bacterium]|jgi:predicted O-methyltransferase YrrM